MVKSETSVEDVLKRVVKEKGVKLDSGCVIRLDELVNAGLVENDLEFFVAAQGVEQKLYVIGPKVGLMVIPGKGAFDITPSEYSILESQLRHFSKGGYAEADAGRAYA